MLSVSRVALRLKPVVRRTPMRIAYTIDRAGWATISISCGGNIVEASASHLRDSLKDLALLPIELERHHKAEVVFMNEPGEVRLLATLRTADHVEVEVRRFADWKSWDLDAGDGDVFLRCRTTSSELRQQVVSALQAVLDDCGIEGYRARWIEHDFPMAEYETLIHHGS